MSEPGPYSIDLENISKVYRIPKAGRESVIGSIAVTWDALMGRYGRKHSMFRHFEALQPLDLKIGVGEAVAIVGCNGSGKSTLLEIISGTLKATTGTAVVNGSLSALLQLGSGFDPDFTGIENVYMNGSMMGLSRNRIDEKLKDILEFADIGDFVYQPVRTYSTGMRLRLAFAVITAVDPDILIIDEALSVGDAFFQSRCVRWLEEYLERKKTFLCVSHDMFMIKRLCRRGIVLDMGKMVCDAEVAEAANLYYRLHRKKPTVNRAINQGAAGVDGSTKAGVPRDREATWTPVELDIKERTGDGKVTIEALRTLPDLEGGAEVGDWLQVEVEILGHETVEEFHAGFGFRDRSGQLIGGHHTFYSGESFSISKGERMVLKFDLKLDLKPQLYLLVVGLAINHTTDDWYDLDCLWDCAKLAVSGPEPFWGLTALPVRNRVAEKTPQ
jgi:ABC-type polysaccharide/polyol phosphate transport system ATPase subunit